MSKEREAELPEDGFLVAGLRAGDAAAFNELLRRYDRLVRYTILRATKDRCLADPDWLESIACETWTGFVTAMRQDGATVPDSVRAYLTRIAHNQAITALRRHARTQPTISLDGEGETIDVESETEDPSVGLENLELLEALRGCVDALGDRDRALAQELESIMARRWQEAASALGMSESTLRSRWKRTLDQLRQCVHGKTGKNLAPQTPGDD